MEEYLAGAAAIERSQLNETELIRQMRDLGRDRDVHVTAVQRGQGETGLNIVMKSSELYKNTPPETVNEVRKLDPRKFDRNRHIDSLIEQIEFIKKQKFSSGLILNPEKVSKRGQLLMNSMERTVEILGSGNSAGDIIKVKDPDTGHPMAQKTIMISQFKRDEIILWLHLADQNMAPEMYSFRIIDNKVQWQMQIVEGKTMEKVIDEVWNTRDLTVDDRRSFALVMLHDMLNIFQEMQNISHSHGDLHSGNIMLDRTMKLKFIDFGSAQKYLMDVDVDGKNIQFDVIGIIRIFSGVFSGYCFNDPRDAKKLLQTNSLSLLNKYMHGIPEERRREMFETIMELFKKVRDPNLEGFANIGAVRELIRRKLTKEEMRCIRHKVAVVLFPEIFQVPLDEESDDHFILEGCVQDDSDAAGLEVKDPDNIWHNHDLEMYASRITEKQLAEFGLLSFK